MADTANEVAEVIFAQAVEIEDSVERNRFLAAACRDNESLRRQVDVLVRDYFSAGSLLEQPVCLPATSDLHSGGRSAEMLVALDNFRVRERLGEGGMGTVYVADQLAPVRRRVALKVVRAGFDSRQVIARFENERQALAVMDHPYIAKVLDGGSTADGRPYFVMELIKGVPINEFCASRGLGHAEILDLMAKVCSAVEHAHQKGIIHRDLKPSNIIVTMQDEVAVPKIIDFGIARAVSRSLADDSIYTAHTQLVGTPLYMSPEQAEMNCLDVDTRSDVYSLGVVLYELLTGTTPFDKELLRKASFDELRRIIREDEPPRPSQRVSTLAAQNDSTLKGRRGADPRRVANSLRRELSNPAERSKRLFCGKWLEFLGTGRRGRT